MREGERCERERDERWDSQTDQQGSIDQSQDGSAVAVYQCAPSEVDDDDHQSWKLAFRVCFDLGETDHPDPPITALHLWLIFLRDSSHCDSAPLRRCGHDGREFSRYFPRVFS